jgi:hypothetical protein
VGSSFSNLESCIAIVHSLVYGVAS